jgi:hypothetical protein
MYLTDMTLNALTFGYLFRHIGITDPPLVKVLRTVLPVPNGLNPISQCPSEK